MILHVTSHWARRLTTLKSSFRDKDKPPKYKDLQTKFQGLPNDDGSSSSSVSASSSGDEDNEKLLETEFDARYGRSFRHMTREALPRLDNYRNILSIRGSQRPTLEELHNATMSNKVSARIVVRCQLNCARQITCVGVPHM